MKISLVIPAHNEEDTITNTIKEIEDALPLDYEIIVVNDNSQDRTKAIVQDLGRHYKNLKLIDNDARKGFANALRKGFAHCRSDFVIPVMADLCDDPKTILDMVQEASRFDIVCGSRYTRGGIKKGGPKLQSFFSRFVGHSLKYLIGIPTSDVSNSFKCYKKNVLNTIETQSEGFELSMEITLKAYFQGFSIAEVPTVWSGRSMGKSKFYLFKAAPAYIRLYVWAIFKKGWERCRR